MEIWEELESNLTLCKDFRAALELPEKLESLYSGYYYIIIIRSVYKDNFCNLFEDGIKMKVAFTILTPLQADLNSSLNQDSYYAKSLYRSSVRRHLQ